MMLVIVGALVVAGLTTLVMNEVRRPATAESTTVVDFEITAGESADAIAQRLQDEGLIRQPLLFKLIAQQRGVADKLEAGQFQLQPRMTTSEIITALQESKVEEAQFTTIEGMRMEQIAEVLVAANIVPSIEAALAVMRNADAFKATHARLKDIPAGGSLEGYLFPSTYRVFSTTTITDVVEKILTDGFDAQYSLFEKEVSVPDRNIHEIVTMASIVQREAANNDEMPHIAHVFWNRLKPEYQDEVGGRLQADPTLQYALGKSGNWWPQLDTLTLAEIDGNTSPYNTRRVSGLPPGPIASAGLRALRSAAKPGADRPDGTPGQRDVYFVAKCGENGTNFADNLEAFNTLQNEYLNCPNPL